MGTGFAPTWLRQVSPPLLHKTTLTTGYKSLFGAERQRVYTPWFAPVFCGISSSVYICFITIIVIVCLLFVYYFATTIY